MSDQHAMRENEERHWEELERQRLEMAGSRKAEAEVTGHGWVWSRIDRYHARCGGPALCPVCADDSRAKRELEGKA